MLLTIYKKIRWQQTIPSEQFKVSNFEDDIWHPHLEKSQLDDKNFVLVDTYKDHMTDSNEPNRLKSNDQTEQTKSVLSSNYVTGDDSPNTILPGRDPTQKGPFNWACKFTLADTPKYDSENYATLVNQNGTVDGGMLGEYVDIYDPNKDSENFVSINNTQKYRLQMNSKSKNSTNSHNNAISNDSQSSQNTSSSNPTPTTFSDSNTASIPPSAPQQGYIYNNLNNQPSYMQTPSTAQLVQQANMQPVYQQSNGYVQMPSQPQYVPQYQQQYVSQYQQPVYIQQPTQFSQPVIVQQQPSQHPATIQYATYVQQPTQYGQPQYVQQQFGQPQFIQQGQPQFVQQGQPQFVQQGQPQYVQQQYGQTQYVQTTPNYVGFGLNQVPTLVYTYY